MTGFVLFTVPLMPLQAMLLVLNRHWARAFPHWYHRNVCRILGLRLDIVGSVTRDRPVLVVANHASWLDIVVISAVAPVSFIAKQEVSRWPFVSTLAKLQRTVFVDRGRRIQVGETADEITARLAAGDAIVLFAEGTSSDGNRVLAFKTSLFAAVKPSANGAAKETAAVVQTLTVAYTRQNGMPLGWAGRRGLGYYGDVAMGSNAWSVLTGGPLHACVRVGEPIPLDRFKDRKELAQWAEQAMRAEFVATLRG